MITRVEILPSGEDDLDAGQRFYEEREPGLGRYFLDSLFADIDLLQVHAGVHRMVLGFHRSLSNVFPYGIYYKVDGDTVRVFAVLDCRQNPALLQQRLLKR